MKTLIASILILSTLAQAQDVTNFSLSSGTSFSNPVFAELDGDTSNGPEIISATADGTVQAFLRSGQQIWSARSPNVSCDSASNRIHSSPAVADLNGDGVPDVIVGYGGPGRARCDGGAFALNGTSGAQLWKFSLKAFAKKEKFGTTSHAVFATPAVADTDGDGKPEIAFGSFDRNLYLLNSDGSVRWYYNAADTMWSSPAFVDVNDDGVKELILASDISGNSRLKPPTKDGGNLYAFKTASRKKKRILFRDKSAFYWMRPVDQVLYSSPAVGELIASNAGPEIAIASGCFFPQNSSDKRGKWVKVVSARSGKVLKTIPTQACSSGSVALGDLIGGGKLSIVQFVQGDKRRSDGLSRLTAMDPESGSVQWVVVPRSGGKNTGSAGSFQSPVIADIDNNGSNEVLLGHGSSLLIYAGVNGEPLACNETCHVGELSTGLDLSKATPTVGKFGDRPFVLISSSRHSTLKLIENLQNEFVSAAGTGNLAQWPMWRGTVSRSGAGN